LHEPGTIHEITRKRHEDISASGDFVDRLIRRTAVSQIKRLLDRLPGLSLSYRSDIFHALKQKDPNDE
jgi:hypothetical protein